MLGILLYFWHTLLHLTIAEQREKDTVVTGNRMWIGKVFLCAVAQCAVTKPRTEELLPLPLLSP